MGFEQTVVSVANAVAGVAFATLFGVAAVKARPSASPYAAGACAGVVATVLALALVRVPIEPAAGLVAVAFFGAAWAASSLEPAPRRVHIIGAAAGSAAAGVLAAFTLWQAWWVLPLAAIAVALLRALWVGRPEVLRHWRSD